MGNRKNDIVLVLSGSSDENKNQDPDSIEKLDENKPDNIFHDFDIEQVNKIMTDIFKLGMTENEPKSVMTFSPSYILKTDSNGAWLFSMTRKAFFKVGNNSQITAVDMISDELSYCVINHDVYEVKNEMIQCVGWN